MCIPRVNLNTTEKEIRNVLDELKLGQIKKIDLRFSKTKKYKCAFIHFYKWYDGGNATIARERLLNGKDIKVIYENPWFWKITIFNF